MKSSNLALSSAIYKLVSFFFTLLLVDNLSLNPIDIGTVSLYNKALTDTEKLMVINSKWSPPSNYKFPYVQLKSQKKYASRAYLEKYNDWIAFSDLLKRFFASPVLYLVQIQPLLNQEVNQKFLYHSHLLVLINQKELLPILLLITINFLLSKWQALK